MRMMRVFAVAVAPLLVTLLFAWLTMEGHLNFGGGCKDMFLAVPLLIWSLVLFLCSVVSWRRKFTIGRSILTSVGVASTFVVSAWVILFTISMLKL